MDNDLQNSNSNAKEINFKELWYVFKKNILWEIIIFLLICSLGVAIAVNSKNYYISSASIMVKANVSETQSQNYNDTLLSKMYVISVCDVMKDQFFLDRAMEICEGDDKNIKAENLSTSFNEESLLIKIKYKDLSEEGASKKLTAVIRAIEKFSEEKVEGRNKYFMANVSVVAITNSSQEIRPKVAMSSDRMKIVLISAFVGLVVAVGYALAILLFADKITSAEKLERITGKKNLAIIDKKKVSKEGTLEDGSFLKLETDKLSDVLIYLNDGDKNKIYQIQSCQSKEGKTTVATNLAMSLGLSQRKTLIIDCDFSHPSVHRNFGLSKKIGITDFFKGEKSFDEIVKNTDKKCVDVITCGDEIEDHTIFFTSDKFKTILAEARKKYDFVLLDCAPVLALSDYLNISPLTDATLLIVQSDKVSSRDITTASRELEMCKANVVGTVLNFNRGTKTKKYYY